MTGTTAHAPAIGYSVVATLPGDRQVTAQCFVAEDETDDVINEKFDRIFRVIDRQKSRYELVDHRKERHKLSETLAQFREDLARADIEFEKAQASLDEQAATLTSDKDAALEAGYAEHMANGRRGPYTAKGTVLQATRAMDAALEQVKAQKSKNLAEREVHLQQITVSIKRYEEAIATLDAKIADLEALFAAPTG